MFTYLIMGKQKRKSCKSKMRLIEYVMQTIHLWLSATRKLISKLSLTSILHINYLAYVTTARYCKYRDKAHRYFSKVHEMKVSKTATVNENKKLSKSLLSLQGIPWTKFPECSTLLGSVRDKIIRQADY